MAYSQALAKDSGTCACLAPNWYQIILLGDTGT